MVDSPTRSDHEPADDDDGAPEEVSPALEMSKRPNPVERVRHVWRYRELLANLVRKELKVKYKDSVLGFVWTLLNPALYLVVFTVVFQEVLGIQIPYYGIFFLSGLVAWNFFSTAISTGAVSIVQNAQLVSKVWFPREILSLAAIGAAIVQLFLQVLVLGGALLLVRRAPSLEYSVALIPAVVVLMLLASALAIGLSAINVYLRDTQHLLELVLLAWFWLTPVAYSYSFVVERLGTSREWLASLNPVVPIVVTFQRALYNPEPVRFAWMTNSAELDPHNTWKDQTAALPEHPLSWYLTRLGWVGLAAVVLMLGALWIFGRLEDNLAEEI